MLIVADDPSFHFNLITVNALFGGFLYTNYSLLLGLLDNSIVEKVKNTKIISKRNSHILKGIIYAGFRHNWFVSGACPDKRFEVPPRNLLFHAKR
ncbi:MAG: hypothetical protein ACLSB9_29660 [Hydrogeniiclostridium mannosilyticum]